MLDETFSVSRIEAANSVLLGPLHILRLDAVLETPGVGTGQLFELLLLFVHRFKIFLFLFNHVFKLIHDQQLFDHFVYSSRYVARGQQFFRVDF